MLNGKWKNITVMFLSIILTYVFLFQGEVRIAASVSSNDAVSVSSGNIENISLLIPSRMDFVIDPWEINKSGQVYSEQFVVENTSEKAGRLILSNIKCYSGAESNVKIQTDTVGLHEGTEKKIYMEMLVDGKDTIIMSEQGAEYNLWMEPGQEVRIQFTGEANENNSTKWKEKDVSVSVTYSWDESE